MHPVRCTHVHNNIIYNVCMQIRENWTSSNPLSQTKASDKASLLTRGSVEATTFINTLRWLGDCIQSSITVITETPYISTTAALISADVQRYIYMYVQNVHKLWKFVPFELPLTLFPKWRHLTRHHCWLEAQWRLQLHRQGIIADWRLSGGYNYIGKASLLTGGSVEATTT
jgi:hypothetical protein